MAHVAKVNELTDTLIQSVTGLNRQSVRYKAAKTATTKGLRDQSHARTNQFDIRARLNGLVEKFAVLDRDDLSDALQERLDDLPTEGRWLPEILSLFLELSDRPVVKTPPDVLKSLENTDTPLEELTWDEIFGPSETDEEGIWQTIEHGYHSSEDDEVWLENDSEATMSTRAISVDQDTEATAARNYIVRPNAAALDHVKSAAPQGRLSSSEQNSSVSELTIVRESLFMLRGLATNLYQRDAQRSKIRPSDQPMLDNASKIAVRDSMLRIASIGSSLAALRRWTELMQPQPYLRTAQASCQRHLSKLSEQISAIECSYSLSSANIVVSLVDLEAKVEAFARPALELSRIVAPLVDGPENPPFTLLDALYECACAAQLAGDDELLAVTSSVLFDSTQTYLRPVTRWIAHGLILTNDDHFLVADLDQDCDLGDLWHTRTTLLHTAAGKPSTPVFLHSFSKSVFALGKARMFLQQLNAQSGDLSPNTEITEARPDFSTVKQAASESLLMPFSELFSKAIEDWIATSTNAAPTLQKSLLHNHGLLSTCAAMDFVYFSADGANFQTFAESLFYRIERQPGRLPNAFLLTELARETLGSAGDVDAEALSITTSTASTSHSTMGMFQNIHLHYDLSWPVRNVTRERSPSMHPLAFNLLLQTFFAHSILASTVFDLRQMHSSLKPSAVHQLLKLRYRLVALVSVLLTHITTVGRILAENLRQRMSAAPDIDAMVAVYGAHRQRLETSLLLGKSLKPVRDAVVSMFGLCEKFKPVWDSATKVGEDGKPKASVSSVAQLGRDFDESLAFVTAGVRGVSRSGGEVLLGALAERLEWMVP